MMESLSQSQLKNMDLKSIDSIINNLEFSEELHFFWLGRQSYKPIWKLQKKIHEKRVNREIPNIVLMLEHEPVYTFGKNADQNYLLDSNPNNAEVIKIDRGGEVTFHGPGQLVCYPIIDLHNYYKSVSWYMRNLEDVIISFLKEYDILAERKPGFTGVWIGDEKICALGVRLSKWVTMHGFALNINPDMIYYDAIIPCGIFEYGVTSLHNLGVKLNVKKIANKIMIHFNQMFSDINNEI